MMIYGVTTIVADDAAAVLRARRRVRLHRCHRCVNNIGPGLGEVGPAVNYGR
jgi:hypothetical protein